MNVIQENSTFKDNQGSSLSMGDQCSERANYIILLAEVAEAWGLPAYGLIGTACEAWFHQTLLRCLHKNQNNEQ